MDAEEGRTVLWFLIGQLLGLAQYQTKLLYSVFEKACVVNVDE